MNALRIGVVGCSSFAKRTMIPALKVSSNAELVAVASRTEEKSRAFAQAFDCDSIVGYGNLLKRKDVDLVYMPLPGGLHQEWVEKAIQAGKHILVEKPFALDYSSAKSLLDLARERGVFVAENYVFHFHRQTRRIKEIVAEGTLGKIVLLRATFAFPPMNADNFRYRREDGGGALLDAGGYVLKAARIFLDAKNLKVLGVNRSFSQDWGVDESGSLLLRAESGIDVQAFYSFNSFYQCSVELLGTEGKLSTNRIFTAPPALAPTLIVEKQNKRFEETILPDHQYKNHWESLVEAIQTNNESQRLEALDEIERQAKITDDVRTFVQNV